MSERDPIVQARGVTLTYGATQALRGVALDLWPGESVALMGPSGSGKSSLLHCLAGVLRPGAGEVSVEGQRVDLMAESQRSKLRLSRIGMVFQFGNLIPELTLLENVTLPLQLLGGRASEARAAAMSLLEALEVAEVSDRRAGAVSGGQAQRAAVARALVHRPRIVFADEPTGALDTVNADRVLDSLLALARDIDAMVLVVTHENRVAAHCSRMLGMHDGVLTQDDRAITC